MELVEHIRGESHMKWRRIVCSGTGLHKCSDAFYSVAEFEIHLQEDHKGDFVIENYKSVSF